jgi:hypothetical protein
MTIEGGRATVARHAAEVDTLDVVRGEVVHLEKLLSEVRGQMIFLIVFQKGVSNKVCVLRRGCGF